MHGLLSSPRLWQRSTVITVKQNGSFQKHKNTEFDFSGKELIASFCQMVLR